MQVIDDLVTLLEREMVRWTGLHLFLLMMVALVIGATIVFWMMSYWEVLGLERLEGMAHIRQGAAARRACGWSPAGSLAAWPQALT